MENKLIGVVKELSAISYINSKDGNVQYEKQTLLLDCTYVDEMGVASKYENLIPIEFFGKKRALLQGINVRDRIEVSFSVNGRKFTKRSTGETSYYISINPKAIVVMKKDVPIASPAPNAQNVASEEEFENAPRPQQTASAATKQQSIDEELPF